MRVGPEKYMKFCVLGSGSKGNCTLVESGKSAILIDAGFSGKEIIRRLSLINRSPEMLTAVLMTHEHGDHIQGVGVLSRRLSLPVYANPATYQASEHRVGTLAQRNEFKTGEPFTVDGLQVHPFAVAHDCADPVGFMISDGLVNLGYCTDTGRITQLIRYHLKKCNGLILEANHDPLLLRDGPYPLPLKQRVLSNQGHLANKDAVGFAAELVGSGLRSLVFSHLSETNNHPDLVFEAARQALGHNIKRVHLEIAGQATPSTKIHLSGEE